jgi:hypothetical protein
MLYGVALPVADYSGSCKDRSFCKWSIYEVTYPGQQVNPEGSAGKISCHDGEKHRELQIQGSTFGELPLRLDK